LDLGAQFTLKNYNAKTMAKFNALLAYYRSKEVH